MDTIDTHKDGTEESNPTIVSETGPMNRALSSYLVNIPSKCDLDEVLPRLTESMAIKSVTGRIGDLENSLFVLSRDMNRMRQNWTISLKPLVLVHPLTALASSTNSPKSTSLVERELKRVIHKDPVLAQRYMWTLKACEFLNDLAIKWRLLDIQQFGHRANLKGSLVLFTQLAECPRMDTLCLLPEVFYVAAAPDSNSITDSTKILCGRVSLLLVQLLELLTILNRDVDFSVTTQIKDYLFRGGRVAPETVSVREKRAVASRIGFHLLRLPKWWKCACMYSEEERTNLLLRNYLKHLCKSYIELEAALALCSV